jgi:hypothetical protein
VRSRAAELGVADLVVEPWLEFTGQYERKIEQIEGYDKFFRDTVFTIDVPMCKRAKGSRNRSRTLAKLPFLLPHEAVHRMWEHDPGLFRASGSDWAQLPVHRDHPLVLQHGIDKVALIHGYVDGVPVNSGTHSSPTSVYCWYWVPIGSIRQLEARHLITAVTKRELCKCGCLGNCTVQRIHEVIAWSLKALEAGTWPGTGPNGEPMTGSRLQLAGQRLSTRGAMSTFVADLEAYMSLLGFKSTGAQDNPCFACRCSRESQHDYTQEPAQRTDADYGESVQKTRVEGSLGKAQTAALQLVLRPDRRKNGGRGRCLEVATVVIQPSGQRVVFQRGDRLMPSESVVDVHQDLNLWPGPARIVVNFFRPSHDSFISTWCPLLQVGAVRLTGCVIDMMHTVDLGVCAYTGGELFAQLIRGGAWNLRQRDLKETMLRYMDEFQRRLLSFKKEYPESECPIDLTPGMLLGARRLDRPCIAAKAAQTRALFFFWQVVDARRVGHYGRWTRACDRVARSGRLLAWLAVHRDCARNGAADQRVSPACGAVSPTQLPLSGR